MNNLRTYCCQLDYDKSNWKENVEDSVLHELNEKGYGIFKSVNIFKDKIRKKENLEKIVAWAIDIDNMDKQMQTRRILDVGIEPSEIIESKRGYHIYWNVRGETSLENYEFMVGKMLIPLFNADVAAKDVTRVLRFEGYYHKKDINNPYLIKKIYSSPIEYTEKIMFDMLYSACKRYNIKLEEKEIKRNVVLKQNEVTAEYIANALNGKKSGVDSYKAICPFHFDKDPSLYITQKPNKVLLHCFGGCEQETIIKGLLGRNLWF